MKIRKTVACMVFSAVLLSMIISLQPVSINIADGIRLDTSCAEADVLSKEITLNRSSARLLKGRKTVLEASTDVP